MNDKLIKDFNKFQEIIKELYEKYDGEPFANNEWNEFIKDGYNLFFPETEHKENDNKPCEAYISPNPNKNISGYTCRIFTGECDGITCKKDCDYYNKRGYFK